MDLGKKVARNEFPHAGPKYVDLFATATQRPRKAFHVYGGIIAPPPLFVKPFLRHSILFEAEEEIGYDEVEGADDGEGGEMGGEDVLEGVGFEEDAAGGGEEVVEGVDGGEVLEEGGHVFDGGDEA